MCEGLSGELDLEERPEERADDFEESLKIPYLRVILYEKIASTQGLMAKSD